MDDFDDPIADLLSDGSNDSFFEDPKVLAKKRSFNKGKAASDIFGLDAEFKPEINKSSEDWLGTKTEDVKETVKVNSRASKTAELTKTESKPIQQIQDDVSHLLDMSFEPKSSTSKKSIIDDILGEKPSDKKKSTISDILGETKQGDKKVKPLSDILGETKQGDKRATPLSDILGETKPSDKKTTLSGILGETKPSDKKISTLDILQSSNIPKKEVTSIAADTRILSQPQSQNINEYAPTISRESRRGRRGSAGLPDPLGIFSIERSEPKSNAPKRDVTDIAPVSFVTEGHRSPVAKTNELPGWLAGGDKPGKETDVPPVQQSVRQQVQQTVQQPVQQVLQQPVQQVLQQPVQQVLQQPVQQSLQGVDHIGGQPLTVQQPITDPSIVESLLTQQKIASSHIEFQNASLALQQQESQLMVAMQLKKYEDNLAEMQRRQQEILTKQDWQFNSLLEKQFARQQAMESSMRAQQERINHHIQVLMAQGGAAHSQPTEENKMLTMLKEQHNQEVFLLEESYKKQLSLLEGSLESTEIRLKTEIDSLQKHFSDKLEDAANEKQLLAAKYEEKIKNLYEQHKLEIDDIKENCRKTVEDVRQEYKLMLEDASNNKLKADAVLSSAGLFTEKLNESLEVLNSNTKVIDEMCTKVGDEKKTLADIRAAQLSAQETGVKMMEARLEKERAMGETERGQVMALVSALQTRLVEQTAATRDERWALQQAAATLAARSAALDRETEYAKQQLERERQQIKTLKETLLAEHEHNIQQVTEEKLALSTEKARLETSARLREGEERGGVVGRAEVEAAVQVAREAATAAAREREALVRQQCELEVQQRELAAREQRLASREQALERERRAAEVRARESERALAEARAAEQRAAQRHRDMQRQLSALAAREKQLTEDKVALSRERLQQHVCRLCQAESHVEQDVPIVPILPTHWQSHLAQDVPLSPHWTTDDAILRLKQDIEQDTQLTAHTPDQDN